MHTFKVAGPAKPEEGDGEGESADAGWGQLFLWRDVPVFVEFFGLVFVFPVEVAWDGEADCGDEDAEEGETALSEVEAVDFAEDYGEGFEPDVEDAIDEGDVEVEEEDNGFKEA